MIDVSNAVIARYKRGGKTFEILVDCDNALLLKQSLKKARHTEVELRDVVAADEVFTDASKGLRCSESDLNAAFGTTDKQEIFKRIIEEGEIQLNQEHRRSLREEKRKQIITKIAELGVDPRTGHVHPRDRIENAMQEAKVKIDEHKSADEQIDEIVKKLMPVLPISFEKKKLAVKIPAQYAAKSFAVLKKLGAKEEWHNDGSLLASLEVPTSRLNDIYTSIGKLTEGNGEIKEIN